MAATMSIMHIMPAIALACPIGLMGKASAPACRNVKPKASVSASRRHGPSTKKAKKSISPAAPDDFYEL